ncbi:putative lipoprotein [Bacteriovorax sp. BAL6_X]|uniref:hypothetical protein n=1 Tax=Bacteriovorax sp. BAL6_X TaxID=1201290 RepID=UPI0003864D6D|nr:hypothetical protein [Bacteriovorax sp. BAL6_X]EPZ49218.1 putative lipoprotein [Bacteriovorax sp. BAL6_X]
MHRHIFGLFLVSLLLSSCGVKTSNTKVTFSKSQFLVGDLSSNFDGGVLIFGRNNTTKQVFQIGLDPSSSSEIEIELPFGNYDVKAIGWHSGATPSNLTGTKYCSQINTDVNSSQTPMNLVMTTSNCASLTNTVVHDSSTGNQFKVETCHGVVQVVGKGKRDSCDEAPSNAQSLKIRYLTTNAEGVVDPSLTLESKCLTPNAGNIYTYNLTNEYNVVTSDKGFYNPVEIIAYYDNNCSGASLSQKLPKSLGLPSKDYLLAKEDSINGLTFLVGYNSCAFDGAASGSPFAADSAASRGINIICTSTQFNNIVSYPSDGYIIGKKIDFAGSTPATTSTDFTGSIQGDILLSVSSKPHIVGASDTLFNSIGTNVTDESASIEHLNIDVNSLTNGPIFAKYLGDSSEFHELMITGSMTNSTPSTTPSGPSVGYSCGALVNQSYFDGTISKNVNTRFERISFDEFKLKCTGLPTSDSNYIGALVGSLTSGATDTTYNREVQVYDIKGSINIEIDSSNIQQSVGGLIGFSENNTNIDSYSNNYAFINSYTSNAPAVIGGVLGQHMSTAANNYGRLELGGSNVHLDINSDLSYGPAQAAGGIVGKIYNPETLQIRSSITTGSINTTLKNAGGVIGHASYANTSDSLRVYNSSTRAIVSADGSAGGLIGHLSLDESSANFGLNHVESSSISGASISSSGLEGAGGALGTLTSTINYSSVNFNNNFYSGFLFTDLGYATGNSSGSLIGVMPNSNSHVIVNGHHYTRWGASTSNIVDYIGFINETSLSNILSRITVNDIVYQGYTDSSTALAQRALNYGTPGGEISITFNDLTNKSLPSTFTGSQFFTADGNSRLDIAFNRFMRFTSNGRAIVTGSEFSPFLISNSEDLLFIRNNLFMSNFNFRLTANIDMGGQFLQLSADNSPFNGSFDGAGFTISNINNDYTGLYKSYNGIFPYVEYGRIKNLRIANSTMSFDCDTSGDAGLLMGRINHYNNYGDDRAQFFNIQFENNTIEGSTGCAATGLVAGTYSTENTGDSLIFENISVKNNNFASPIGSLFVDKIDYSMSTSETFAFKNLEFIGNMFTDPAPVNTYAFFSNKGTNTFNVSYENVLYIGHTDGYNPTDIHSNNNAGSAISLSNHYVFINPNSFVGILDTGVLTNGTSYVLADMATTTFDQYFIVNSNTGAVSLNRPYIKEEMDQR